MRESGTRSLFFFLATTLLSFILSLLLGFGGVFFSCSGFLSVDYIVTPDLRPSLAPILSRAPRIFSPPQMATDQEAGNALKLQGNKAFGQHDWPVAVDFYNQAIEKYDKDPSFFCNRAQVRFRRSWWHILKKSRALAQWLTVQF
jgi:hypothetical protein